MNKKDVCNIGNKERETLREMSLVSRLLDTEGRESNYRLMLKKWRLKLKDPSVIDNSYLESYFKAKRESKGTG